MSTAKARRLKLVDAALPASGTPESHPESHYEALFDQASDAIVTVDENGVIEAANQAIEELTGYLKVELVGKSIDIFVPKVGIHKIPQRSRPIERPMLLTPGTYEDVCVLRKDGYFKFVDFIVRKVTNGEAVFTLTLFRDVTEKKRMERELITKHTELLDAYKALERSNAELKSMQETLVQAGKMAALGELSAGIAHELNQPLQGIRGHAQELQDVALPALETLANTDLSTSVSGSLKDIITSVDKMAGIIGYFRTFVRKSTENFEFTQVQTAIDEATRMLTRQLSARGIVIHKDFAPGLPEVYANPLQLEQVFINLASNARDAIEATGRGSGNIWIKTQSGKDFVEVSFRDDGVGMNEKTKSKVFNPFFTTKEVGKGMGLGMSLSYGILSKLQASIVVESELGKGAEFLIKIPKDYRELA